MSERTFRAMHRGAPMAPRKARYVADLVRGKPVNEALDTLRYCPRRAAAMFTKVVMSALANAQQDSEVNHHHLHVVDVRADDGQTFKRWTPRSRGQMYPLLKRYSNLTVVLQEKEPAEGKRTRTKADRSRRARVAASRAAQQPGGGEDAGGDATQEENA